MINFNSFMPAEIIFGKDCVLKNREKFEGYKKIFIVSGKSSAKLSGALDDILMIINDMKSDFYIFDKVQENPLLSTCYEGGRKAADFGADLIIGIGGGSPLDASKAVALFAGNPDIAPDDLYNPPYKNPSLPIFAVPTTAGTGSEANAYSVITLDGKDLKKTFTYVQSYPKISFLDPKYTLSLSYNNTVSTALDALCHCIEAYLSVKATPFSIIYASMGIKNIYPNLVKLTGLKEKPISEIDYLTREELMFGSLCGGVTINTASTCFPHPLGYNLTLINGLPHGKACAVFVGEFINLHENEIKTGGAGLDDPAILPKLTKNFNEMLADFKDPIDTVKENIKILADYHEKYGDETLKFYVSKIKTARNFTNSFRKVTTDEEMFEIYKKCVGK